MPIPAAAPTPSAGRSPRDLSRTAADWIRALRLGPHPEGGHYRETYRSAELLETPPLPPRFGGPRCFSTAIYFLLQSHERSRLHRIKSDEVWHFYDGNPLSLFVIAPDGRLAWTVMGRNPERGEALQAVVPAGSWYGALVEEAGGYALVGGTVAPGFDFADFEMADRAALSAAFPQHRALIERLTPPSG